MSQGNYALQGRLLLAVESSDLNHFGSKIFQDIHLEVFGFLVNQEGDLTIVTLTVSGEFGVRLCSFEQSLPNHALSWWVCFPRGVIRELLGLAKVDTLSELPGPRGWGMGDCTVGQCWGYAWAPLGTCCEPTYPSVPSAGPVLPDVLGWCCAHWSPREEHRE